MQARIVAVVVAGALALTTLLVRWPAATGPAAPAGWVPDRVPVRPTAAGASAPGVARESAREARTASLVGRVALSPFDDAPRGIVNRFGVRVLRPDARVPDSEVEPGEGQLAQPIRPGSRWRSFWSMHPSVIGPGEASALVR